MSKNLSQPQKACPNCGGNEFDCGTPKENKGAIMRAYFGGPNQRWVYDSAAGTPVNVFACTTCGFIQMFAIPQGGQ